MKSTMTVERLVFGLVVVMGVFMMPLLGQSAEAFQLTFNPTPARTPQRQRRVGTQTVPCPGTTSSTIATCRRSSRSTTEWRLTATGDNDSSEDSPTLPVVKKDSIGDDDDDVPPAAVTVERVVKDNFPDFHKLLSKNKGIFRTLEQDFSDGGYTIFAPNAQAFAELTDQQRMQLDDPRNLETVQKMGLFHLVSVKVLSLTELNREDWTVPKTAEGLPALKYSALITMGGEVPIGRFKKKMDGSFWRSLLWSEEKKKKTVRDKNGKPVTEIVVGPSGTILRSVKVGNAMIHEVDGFVSPLLLWRYFDQMRFSGM